MLSSSAVLKGAGLLIRPRFLLPYLRYRVAAASEHIEAVRFCAANTLIDAGANKGQFSLVFRRLRPSALIVAFEPLPEAADKFQSIFRSDPHTRLVRVALAGSEGTAEFHVADRADSSSLLRPGAGQAKAFGVHPAKVIRVPVKRLDECIDMNALAHPVLLKVDVQGGELGVFDGLASIEKVDFIYVELSYVELYDPQPLFEEVREYLSLRGFYIRAVYNQVRTREYGPTQIDVLFQRSPIAAA